MRAFTSLAVAVAALLLIAVSGQVGPVEAEQTATKEDMKPLVLVAGATGKTGTLVVAQLQEKGYPVRAFVRSAAKAAERLGPEVEAAVGDLRAPASIAAALEHEEARTKVFEIYARDGEAQTDFSGEFAALRGS